MKYLNDERIRSIAITIQALANGNMYDREINRLLQIQEKLLENNCIIDEEREGVGSDGCFENGVDLKDFERKFYASKPEQQPQTTRERAFDSISQFNVTEKGEAFLKIPLDYDSANREWVLRVSFKELKDLAYYLSVAKIKK